MGKEKKSIDILEIDDDATTEEKRDILWELLPCLEADYKNEKIMVLSISPENNGENNGKKKESTDMAESAKKIIWNIMKNIRCAVNKAQIIDALNGVERDIMVVVFPPKETSDEISDLTGVKINAINWLKTMSDALDEKIIADTTYAKALIIRLLSGACVEK